MNNKFLKIFTSQVTEMTSAYKSLFVDLTPVNNADIGGSYTEALDFAFKNKNIKNIALTGPYGSGKSSIIKTFSNNRDYKFLNISLASFKEASTPDVGKIENTVLVERSILQQMLYGADANVLPYSRFKRIKIPESPQIKSFLFVMWALASLIIYFNRFFILDFEELSLLWVGGIIFIAFIIAFPIVLISDLLKLSTKISFKKISLTNAEIETAETQEASILNKHLDEIIYFFQVTNYDAVVIEDLDRFGSPEIFVKLREINKLINESDKTNGDIKFLYALRDDMFAHSDRTKFFDFIIPVVPIINSSNSLDKMHERLKNEPFENSIDPQFLREVSLYVDDLRLIHNIFNEFIIYHQRLNSDSLDVTKLLAMMIYKNAYPNDFELLHHGKGALFEVCKMRSELIKNNKKRLKDEIAELRNTIDSANNEHLASVQELIKLYIGHIITYANQPVIGVVCNNQHLLFSQINSFDKFEPLLNDDNIHLVTHKQEHPSHRTAINKSISQIEKEVGCKETFLSRKLHIESKLDVVKTGLYAKISDLERKMIEIPQKQLHDLLKDNGVQVDTIIENNTGSDRKLLTYLIKNGYLDENYHIYTSNFHEGRLTKNDRDFLLTIRNFNQPDPKQQIDTPEEVCKNMRFEDFGHNYVLNVDLMDFLLGSNETNAERIISAVKYISNDIENAENFFIAYYDTGKHIDVLIRSIAFNCPEFISSAVISAQGAEHVSYVIRFVDPTYIVDNMNTNDVLTKFVSEQGHLIFASEIEPPVDFAVLEKLNVKIADLQSVAKNYDLLNYAHEHNLYTITPNNVEFVLEKFSENKLTEEKHHLTANYTTIMAIGSSHLKHYIDKNLSRYIDNVFLVIPENNYESGETIKILINNAQIDDDTKKMIVSKEQYIFDNFDDISIDIWPHILDQEKIIISWFNICVYLNNDNADKNNITELFKRQHIVNNITQHTIDINILGEDNSKMLSTFIITNNDLPDDIYHKLVLSIPYKYTKFPSKLSDTKQHILASNSKVTLNDETFKAVASNETLMVKLISANIDEYLSNKDKYQLNDSIREQLLVSKISNEIKQTIIQDIDPSTAKSNKELSKLIADVIKISNINCDEIADDVLSSAIIFAGNTDDSIKILIKNIPSRSKEWTMGVLAQLPAPFNEIASYGKRPKLPKTKQNYDLAILLEMKHYVSTIKEKPDEIRINTFNSSENTEPEQQ